MSALLEMTDLQPESIETSDVAFGEWLPDVAALSNPGAVEALNVIPGEGGSYIPFAKHSPDKAIPEQALGAYAVALPDDFVQVYAGGANGLYSRIGGLDFSQILTTPVRSKYHWKFIRVNEQMVALHPDIQPVRTPVGTLTAPVTVGGTPPKAVCGAQVGDFLMLGNLFDDPDDPSPGPFSSRVRWSGHNNIDSPWVTDVATQADFQDLPAEGGPVMAINGREVATIYQARMISRATYRGLPAVFDIVTAEDKRGAIARDCVIDMGQMQAYIAEDGFFIWNGTNSTPIGDSRVNRYFFNQLEYGERNRICGAVDFINGCLVWAFPTDASGLLNELIIYSYRENKWSHSIQTMELLMNSAASNMTLDELTDPLESYTISFDDPYYRRGAQTHIAAFSDTHSYGLFSGLPMEAVLDTGEYSGPEGRRVFVNGVRPIVDVGLPLVTVQAVYRDQLIGAPVQYTDPIAQEIDGRCPVMADGRYMRLSVTIPEDLQWTHATGVEVSRKATGVF